jgi:DNA-binding response OmpR family regulator
MQSKDGEGDTPHLLVIDDDLDMGECIADVAARVGYRCAVAADTVHVQTALGPDVTLMLLDLMMPGTDGVELLRMLGHHGYAGRLVLMSGGDKRVLERAEDLAKALGLHVLRHFQKPIRLVELEAFLRQQVTGHQDAVTDARARIIVHKTIELGHGLGMRVVAEGVEPPQHLDLLKAHACDVAQGSLFSRPLALPDLVRLARAAGARRVCLTMHGGHRRWRPSRGRS